MKKIRELSDKIECFSYDSTGICANDSDEEQYQAAVETLWNLGPYDPVQEQTDRLDRTERKIDNLKKLLIPKPNKLKC